MTDEDGEHQNDHDTPSKPAEIPPELKAVPRDEMRKALETLTLVALKLSRSKRRADELVSDVYIKLTTTRRWDPEQSALVRHMLAVLKSEFRNEEKKQSRKHEASVQAAYHREIVGGPAPSPEQLAIDHEEATDAQSRAAREVASLRLRIADHPLAPGVLQLKEDGIDEPKEIARLLNVPAKAIYNTLALLKYHLGQVRAAGDTSDDDDEWDENDEYDDDDDDDES